MRSPYAQPGSRRHASALDQQADSSKAARLLGWQPRHGGFSAQAEAYYGAWGARKR